MEENTPRQTCKHSNQQQIDCSGLERHCCWGQGSVKPSPGVQVVPGGRKEGMERWRDQEGGSLTQTEESLY